MAAAMMWTALFVLSLITHSRAMAGSTADAAIKKGFIQCGVNTGLAGFAQTNKQGEWQGIDIDVCRAVAAALFGDARKVRYTPLTAQQRFTACNPVKSKFSLAIRPGQ
jgi:general L-amino acid transport system substrate-binding protein